MMLKIATSNDLIIIQHLLINAAVVLLGNLGPVANTREDSMQEHDWARVPFPQLQTWHTLTHQSGDVISIDGHCNSSTAWTFKALKNVKCIWCSKAGKCHFHNHDI